MKINPPAAIMGFVAASFAVVALYGCTQATAAPCAKHVGEAKVVCIKAQKAKRDKMPWPPRPSEKEVIKRIGIAEWHKAERVAVCETGANWQHFPNGNYIGGMGMFRQTYGIGQAVTHYRWVSEGASKAEQIAIAHIVATRFGWSAWGCGGA